MHDEDVAPLREAHTPAFETAQQAMGQTGAAWQRQALAALTPQLGRERALRAMLEHYLEHQRNGEPVHTWPLPSGR